MRHATGGTGPISGVAETQTVEVEVPISPVWTELRLVDFVVTDPDVLEDETGTMTSATDLGPGLGWSLTLRSGAEVGGYYESINSWQYFWRARSAVPLTSVEDAVLLAQEWVAQLALHEMAGTDANAVELIAGIGVCNAAMTKGVSIALMYSAGSRHLGPHVEGENSYFDAAAQSTLRKYWYTVSKSGTGTSRLVSSYPNALTATNVALGATDIDHSYVIGDNTWGDVAPYLLVWVGWRSGLDVSPRTVVIKPMYKKATVSAV